MLFERFRRKKIEQYVQGASAYMRENWKERNYSDEALRKAQEMARQRKESSKAEDGIKYSLRNEPPKTDDGLRYSVRDMEPGSDDSGSPKKEEPHKTVGMTIADAYHPAQVARLIRELSVSKDPSKVLRGMDNYMNRSFAERMMYYIGKSGKRDSVIYKKAQVDKRLYSKLMTSNGYKPSLDTVIALALALELSLEEAEDLLSRAGYTLSHSRKRDVIIEYFFRERIYNLFDVNEVLTELQQKPLGRS